MNYVALITLFAWVPLAQLFFARFRAPTAALFVLLGGVMFLPEIIEYDLPGLPPYNKRNAITLSMLIGAAYACPRRLMAARPGTGYDLLTIALSAGSFLTIMTNGDTLFYGPHVEEGLRRVDAISMAVGAMITIGIPFFLGRAFFRNMRDLRTLAMALAIAGLIYSVLIVFEARFSPHLHKWVYGYHPAPFRHMIRSGGWKPMAFMGSGLAVGLFIATAMISASALAAGGTKVRGVRLTLLLPYLAGILALCRSFSSIVYGYTLAPLAYFMPIRGLALVVVALATIVVSYPIARATGIFPTEQMVEGARAISEERAQSLEFRFDNEDILLEKARERLLFGWGIWGRSRVYDDRGRDISVTDGFWIIQLGSRGLLGFACSFAVLMLPALVMVARIRRIPSVADRRVVLALCLVVMTYTIDLLPNTLWSSVPIFMSGALAGAMTGIRRARRVRAPSPPEISHQNLATLLRE